MKAHIVREPRCALVWNYHDESGLAALRRAAGDAHLTLRPVGNGDLGATVGDLCAGKPTPAAAPLIAVPDRPALILSGLSHQTGELGAFLDQLQAAGVTLPLRAMVTPTSKGWTLAQLLLELNSEHDAVQGDKA
ncbi:MAG TPA: DUF3783 domain-containing protein [Candidatus Gemmiger excrementavium]|uniref:DUF3783 domain-containing protein n=1 Tax=Candidatus Gemmiger excrementavium TaxID=2838608 RepID=A0A9D2JE65_9FIRM|nr:DUF3783 domain-containing protein [Candidatus Gemmiger excrementavium]